MDRRADRRSHCLSARVSGAVLFSLVLTLPLSSGASSGCSLASAQQQEPPYTFTVKRAQGWIDLLQHDHGWTGADGCLSIPLDGIEGIGQDPHPITLFTFGDSIIGDVGPDGRRVPGAMFVNNSLLYVDGKNPDPARARFWFQRDAHGNPVSAFLPATPDAQPGDFYWLADGVAVHGSTYLFGIHLRPDPNGGWPLNQGIGMITLPQGSTPPFENQTQVKTPLYVPASGDLGPIQFPACFMSNTEAARAPHPDGYIYIYGAREDPFVKKAIVARVLPDDFVNFEAWRYWNGSDWVEGIKNVAPMTGRISGAYSVVPLPDGHYLMVFQQDTIGPNVAVRVGDSPVGPWGPLRAIYHCPEPDQDPDIYCYNATAHPSLSNPGELLISYSVNSWDFNDAFWIAAVGRPRFITLKIERQEGGH